MLSVGEKISCSDCKKKPPPESINPGKPERIDYEDVQYETKSLIFALLVYREEVIGNYYDRHRRQEFLDFLNQIETCFPSKELHLILDNVSVHKHKKVEEYPKEREDRISLHFIPTRTFWLNQIELWFSILSCKSAQGIPQYCQFDS